MSFYSTFGISEEVVEMLKRRYTPGTRVELISLEDPYNRKLREGDLGTILHVDDVGTIHVNWDCGSSLGLIYGEDSFRIV